MLVIDADSQLGVTPNLALWRLEFLGYQLDDGTERKEYVIDIEIIGMLQTLFDLFPLPFAPTIHIREFISTPKFSPRNSHGLKVTTKR